MRIVSVVGARPQFVKLAPMHKAVVEAGHDHLIIHTGQHYAAELSEMLFADLLIPDPDLNLGVGSGSHAAQTAAMMTGLESAFEQLTPDRILLYGDTNSTLAGAVVAAKLHLPMAHLEAGLRSGNRAMPEEHNRVVTDHLADLLLAPTETAMAHLAHEGLSGRSRLVGDVMADICLRVRDSVRAAAPTMPDGWRTDGGTVIATLHRAENTDDPELLDLLLSRLAGAGLDVLLLAHPRLVARAEEFGIALERPGLTALTPFSYSQLVYAVDHAVGVVTDSGGLQKEAYLLGTPCVTARTETEWPETLTDGWNAIEPHLDLDLASHFARRRPDQPWPGPFGDGHAAEAAVAELVRDL